MSIAFAMKYTEYGTKPTSKHNTDTIPGHCLCVPVRYNGYETATHGHLIMLSITRTGNVTIEVKLHRNSGISNLKRSILKAIFE